MYVSCQSCKATAIRIGWVPDPTCKMDEAPEWLLANYWSDARLIGEFEKIVRSEPD